MDNPMHEWQNLQFNTDSEPHFFFFDKFCVALIFTLKVPKIDWEEIDEEIFLFSNTLPTRLRCLQSTLIVACIVGTLHFGCFNGIAAKPSFRG